MCTYACIAHTQTHTCRHTYAHTHRFIHTNKHAQYTHTYKYAYVYPCISINTDTVYPQEIHSNALYTFIPTVYIHCEYIHILYTNTISESKGGTIGKMRHFSGSGRWPREGHGCEYDQINDKHVKTPL